MSLLAPRPAVCAVLDRLLEINSNVFCAMTDFRGGDGAAQSTLVEALGQHYMLVLELIKLDVVGMGALKQAAGDYSELLAAKPELVAPHVVVVSPDRCEHEHLSLDRSNCLSCKTVFVHCAPCEFSHAAPDCTPR